LNPSSLVRFLLVAKPTNNKLALKVEEMEQEVLLKEGLPHLYGKKHYEWSAAYVKSVNRMNFLCAANQIGKSSANIRKCITWATSPHLWKRLWPTRPQQFWYFYPSKNVCTDEFNEKWAKEWLPRGEFKTHLQFGWEADVQQKKIVSIRFNTGVTVYFRSYEQKLGNIQTASVHAVFADEEMPVEVYNEVIMRISAPTICGYFHMVFTATLGLDFWREVIEEKGARERFPTAWKRQVSMYDCLRYQDGTQSPWTLDSIKAAIVKCRSPAEVSRRIMGRFVVDEGLKYESYRRAVNFVKPYPIPPDWLHFSGADIGSGGEQGHPGALAFVAVAPDFSRGACYDGWRGDYIETTAGDIFQKYRLMRGPRVMVGEYYDHQARDYFTIASRCGESLQKAQKSHEIGEQVLNTLFKNGQLDVFDTPELTKLDHELQTVQRATVKQKAKDDFTDALRYACTNIPWDFACLLPAEMPAGRTFTRRELANMSERERRSLGMTAAEFQQSLDVYQGEFDEANSLMGYDW